MAKRLITNKDAILAGKHPFIEDVYEVRPGDRFILQQGEKWTIHEVDKHGMRRRVGTYGSIFQAAFHADK